MQPTGQYYRCSPLSLHVIGIWTCRTTLSALGPSSNGRTAPKPRGSLTVHNVASFQEIYSVQESRHAFEVHHEMCTIALEYLEIVMATALEMKCLNRYCL